MKCRECPNQALPGSVCCVPCRVRRNDYRKKVRAEKRARGECYECTAPAVVDTARCDAHSKKLAAKQKERRAMGDDTPEPVVNVPRCRCGLLDDGHDHDSLRATYYAENRRGEQATRDSL